jgi:hypothetical protein
MAKKVFTATFIRDGGGFEGGHVIRHKGALWLVPSWLQSPASGTLQPERMIRLDRLRHQTTTKGAGFDDYLVQEPIPTNVLSGASPPAEEGKYVVLLEPDIFLSEADVFGSGRT